MGSKITYYCDRCNETMSLFSDFRSLYFKKQRYFFGNIVFGSNEMMLCPACTRSLEQWMANHDRPQG